MRSAETNRNRKRFPVRLPGQKTGELRHTSAWYVRGGTLAHGVIDSCGTGFSEKEAMEISGHKTRAVFDRYHIVSETRLKQLATKHEQHCQGREQRRAPKAEERNAPN